MNKVFPLGSLALLAIFGCGLWLASSPFVLQTQTAGRAWLPATLNAFIVGAALATIAALGILAWALLGLRDLVRASEMARRAPRDLPMQRSAGMAAVSASPPPAAGAQGGENGHTHVSGWR
jgi:hypothetical protein